MYLGESKYEFATLGGGCFWCTEAIFTELKGVKQVTPGYSGGDLPNPTYEQVCTGKTGHAEVVHIEFDPNMISYEELLKIFFTIHDPTTLNRQGNDIGMQYRSIILYHNEEQKETAKKVIKEFAYKIWGKSIVTELMPFKVFYKAEDYHLNYYKRNPSKPYCVFVITPKILKFKKLFHNILREHPY